MATVMSKRADDTSLRDLNALIVRNIGDIEAAIARATEELDKRLWEEMAAVVEGAVARYGWRSDNNPEEHDVWFSFGNADWWKDDKTPQFWFAIDEITGPTDDTPHSWIAEAVADNPQGARLGLILVQDVLKARALARVIKDNADLVAQMAEHKIFLNANNALFIGLDFDKETLAKAFEEEDFDGALEPLATAIETIFHQQKPFDEIVSAIRAEETRS